MRALMILLLIIAILILPFFMGKWCRYNTELLVLHYSEKEIHFPNWPFVVGAYCTQASLPYGVITEIWTRTVGVKK